MRGLDDRRSQVAASRVDGLRPELALTAALNSQLANGRRIVNPCDAHEDLL
jgi:hypothetical protein